MAIERGFPNILSKNIDESAKFFMQLLNMKEEFSSDWFIHLKSEEGFEIGILPMKSEIIPQKYHEICSGTMLTYCVPDVDELHAKIKKLNCNIIDGPTNLFYGQRRILLSEKYSGVLVDLSSECDPSEEFLASFT